MIRQMLLRPASPLPETVLSLKNVPSTVWPRDLIINANTAGRVYGLQIDGV
jgi:hypothetical protein